jgi:thiosulfate/3-mercaptopyruvate sulfurtransferase
VVPLEPWEKVFIKLVGRQKSYADIDEVHALIGCVTCHGGNEPADFESAHVGVVKDPSIDAESNCNPCHAEIVATNANSMHSKLWGERTSIAQRELGAGEDHISFDGLPTELTEGFERECMSCHTTCGQCHISRPNSAAGGFIENHKFKKTPDQTNNCLACHGSRIAVDFEGQLEGVDKDVHNANYKTCLFCHKENMHADASNVPTRYHLPDLPKCDGCHSKSDNTNNFYHNMHWPGEETSIGTPLSCFVCHSQPYNNCNSCHTKDPSGDLSVWWQTGYGESATETDVHIGAGGYREYPDFKIGYNYNQELHDGEFIVVRHIPVVRNSYSPWGHDDLLYYDDRPTWEYTSPHNIKRFTAQTTIAEGANCGSSCHLTGNNATENMERYLWQRDFGVETDYFDELEANRSVVVDDKLPDTWQKP